MMHYLFLRKPGILVGLLLISGSFATDRTKGTAPAFVKGSFTDDYGIKYTITDTLWTQLPRTRFHIIRWNTKDQYLVARNDAKNPGEPGLYTRIDYLQFEGMDPWKWGFCLSAYDAANDSIAEATAVADRKNPKKGCNGYPFSRMKRIR
ncbi:hypothetical protein [Hufsiella ginkgonis]|uniref:Uncharacterized protein n=1 Tax=Hufsiella ginkgonis TaxID=2695274 RepID=A0A7K1XXZ2_9SPHI|nr:hypothetical protein [Hufsiella ginkgonis]MXV15609.1 hypothetical protein [Hufsiella ginkgonis]